MSGRDQIGPVHKEVYRLFASISFWNESTSSGRHVPLEGPEKMVYGLFGLLMAGLSRVEDFDCA